MAFRFVCLCALLAIARAGNIAAPLAVAPIAKLVQPAVAAVQAVPVAKAAVAVADNQYDPHPQYNYAYDIQVKRSFLFSRNDCNRLFYLPRTPSPETARDIKRSATEISYRADISSSTLMAPVASLNTPPTLSTVSTLSSTANPS